MNKKLVLSQSAASILICSIAFIVDKNYNVQNKLTQATIKSPTAEANYIKIPNLSELKKQSELIVEVIVTDKKEIRDYKGIPITITIANVKEVLRGNTDSKELKILQDSKADVNIKNGENLLMFLKKGVDNPDCYIPVGSGQGIYKIVKGLAKDGLELTPQSLVNEDILKDLKGNYSDIKSNLKH
jgi:hypothetical protein